MKFKLIFTFVFLQPIMFGFSQNEFEVNVTINKKYLGCYLDVNSNKSFSGFIYPKKITDTQFIIKGGCKDEFELLHFEIQETSIISKFDLFISNSKIKININNISIDKPFNVEFTEVPFKKEQEKYLLVQQANNIDQNKIKSLVRDASYDSLYSILSKKNIASIFFFINENPSSFISFYCFENELIKYQKLNPDTLLKVYNSITNEYTNKQCGIDLKAKIVARQKQFHQNEIHSKFPSFNFISSTNQQFSFDELSKNKTVLIIFWASWCGPCRREIPTLKNIYQKFNSKNFQMISVSLDSNIMRWKKAVIDEQMPWLQTVDKTEFIKDFNFYNFLYFTFIPQCFVIKNGEIIFNNLINEDSDDCKKLIELLTENIS